MNFLVVLPIYLINYDWTYKQTNRDYYSYINRILDIVVLQGEEGVTTTKFLLLVDQLSIDQKHHLSIKDIGIILERLSSKILDVERLDRDKEDTDIFNWTIKATIRGDVMRELGVIYNSNYYSISEHPAYLPDPASPETEEIGE